MEELDSLIQTYYRALWQPSRTLSEYEHVEFKKPRQNFHQKFVTVYGKSYCDFCRKARAMVDQSPDAVYIELEENFVPRSKAHTPHIEKSKTIPIVFVNDDYLGGFDELENFFRD
jgi:glutaredoxin